MLNEMQYVARPLGVVFDCADPVRLSTFWQGLVGGVVDPRTLSDTWVGLRQVPVWGSLGFQKVPEGKVVKNRVHLDLDVDDLEAAIAAARGHTSRGNV